MQSIKNSILGISIGTRIIGVAIVCDDTLVEWRILTFKDKWTEKKRTEILTTIQVILSAYNVVTVSMKKICPIRASFQLIELDRSFRWWCRTNNFQVKEYTIEQIRAFQESTTHLLEKDLEYEHEREQQINTPYYAKVFEAVSLAQMGSEAPKVFHAKKSH